MDDDDLAEKKGDNNELTVRGRIFDQTKPETFNQVCSFSLQITHIFRIYSKKSFEFLLPVVDLRRTTSPGRATNRVSARAD